MGTIGVKRREVTRLKAYIVLTLFGDDNHNKINKTADKDTCEHGKTSQSTQLTDLDHILPCAHNNPTLPPNKRSLLKMKALSEEDVIMISFKGLKHYNGW